MENFTEEDIRNLLALIAVAPIKGSEASVVADLQKKLSNILPPEGDKKKEK